MSTQLPGGIVVDGKLRKDFHFKSVDGTLENLLSECVEDSRNLPLAITRILNHALTSLGGEASTVERVRSLSVGDRHFLLKELASHMDNKIVWLTAHCSECQEPMDVSFRYQDLPTKEASKDFPQVKVKTSLGVFSARSPTGSDQEALAEIDDEEQALELLLERVLKNTDDMDQVLVKRLKEKDIAAIENALETLSPEVANELSTECPHCNTQNRVPIDFYSFLNQSSVDLLSEVHCLAANYHWSEQDILNLPRSRRRRYLQLIDRAQGKYGAESF